MNEHADIERRINVVEKKVETLEHDTNCSKIWQAGTTERLDNLLVLFGKLEAAFTKLEANYENIKARPAKRWESFVMALIGACAAVLVAYIVNIIQKGG